MLKSLRGRVLNEPVFLTSVLLVLVTSFYAEIDIEAIDWKVIAILFNLMSVIVALEKYRILDRISLYLISRFTSIRYLSYCLVLLTGFFAMFITNDVALLTLVPLTLLIAKRCKFNPVWIVIYQTLAANIGSSLTPMGNPQNLFLFEFFHIGSLDFIRTVLPLVIAGFAVLLLLLLKIPHKQVHYKLESLSAGDNFLRQIIYLLMFTLVVLAVLRVLDYRIVLIGTIITTAFLDADIFLKIDYFLLGTFMAFFLFVDNVSHLPGIKEIMAELLSGEGHTFLWGALSSQIISNVPAAVLLANFSGDYRELLLGVNVGGMGTLVASLASLISYKLYCKEYSSSGYLLKFHLISITGFVLFLFAFYFCTKS